MNTIAAIRGKRELTSALAPADKLYFLHLETPLDGYVRILWQVLLYFTVAFSGIAFLLLTHLCGFHIFLRMRSTA